jgi:CHAT domain-containing protein/tetratricopeptide (TPR) repeat protein
MTRALLTFLLLVASVSAFAAQLGEISGSRPAEFMVYQYPDVALVIKIEAAETEFDAEIFGPEKALIKSSGVPLSRIGPLYQFVESVDKPRQLMIKITPSRPVDRSQVNMELIQLPDRDWNSASFGQAYKLLSHGTEKVHSNDSTTWSMKIYTLTEAARAFAGLGWEEMRLWSEFYAAHLVLHKLNDVLMAMERVSQLQDAARRAGYEEIELASLVLEAEALQFSGERAKNEVAYQRYEQLHAVLDQVVILTDQMNLTSEKARALFNDGLAYEQQGRMDDAVRRFQTALDVALTTSNTELTNEIRGTAAAAYESQGSTMGAIELLEDISGDLESETGQEFTDNLFEKGRLLNSTYRYREAAAELDLALSIQQADAATGSWGPTGLALAWSWFSMGEMERARSLIIESIPRTELATDRAALIRAYDVLARIHRHRREFEPLARYRAKQEELLQTGSDRAHFEFETAIDAWKKDGAKSSRATELMMEGGRLATASGESLARHRADMYLCLFRLENRGQGACSTAATSRSYDALSTAGIPWLALEANLVKARVLNLEGRQGEALSLLGNLVDDLLFFSQELPGILGSWYWLTKDEVFKHYLEVAAAGSTGEQTLIALDRVRLADRPESGGEAEESLRSLLARRESAVGEASMQLAARANAQWRGQRGGFSPATAPINARGLEDVLNGLPGDAILLTYYFSESAVHALVGNRRGVSMQRLAGFRKLAGQLERLQRSLADSGEDEDLLPYLDALGQSLVEPLADSLAPRIFFLPSGPLRGIPLDAMRLDGRFLAERHQVVNMDSLAGASLSAPVIAPGFREKVFLAGNPQTGQDLFSYDIRVSAEINTVTDAFVGPGLNIVQGVALQRDEFQDPRFFEAGLIHLAIPGTLDLASPEHSMLLMSRTSEESAVDNLLPADIRGLNFSASLVVLSRTTVSSLSQSGFDSRLGFVSDFLRNGARNVVVSLRSRDDSEAAVFMADFYKELESSQNVTEALSRSKIKLMKTVDPGNFMSWAGFQLYIR